jgi:hypothetical protein
MSPKWRTIITIMKDAAEAFFSGETFSSLRRMLDGRDGFAYEDYFV